MGIRFTYMFPIQLELLTRQVCAIIKDIAIFQEEERKHFNLETVKTKNAHDYVSYVDKESERKIVSALSRLLPEAGFITEEGSAQYTGEPYCWVVDPLDGTTNYIHGTTPYCISIGLRTKDELVLGVVYDPSLDECFYAWTGGGAWLNGKQIHVSATAFEDALLGVELPYNADAYKQTALQLIQTLYGRVGGIRMNGSAALALCYVAAGRLDGWLEAYLGKWDFSAASVLVKEAGGIVTDFYGSNPIDGHHIIAANNHVHRALLDITRRIYENR